MDNIPNLDYNILRKLLKKSIMPPTQERPDDDEEEPLKRVEELPSYEERHEKMEGLPLEEALEKAVSEKNYEEAAKIKEEMTWLKKKMESKKRFIGTLCLADYKKKADNLDLVEINKPYDEGGVGQTRKRHRFRFRNEPGGSDEGFWEGMDGTKNQWRGVGTDQQSDVGSPASINIANINKKVKKPNPYYRKPESNLPNEQMERDVLEEKQTTETWREFNDFQFK